MANDTQAREELVQFARSYNHGGIVAHDARVYFDERQDGEPVTRIALVLNDPLGETWDLDAVTELRRSLGRKATELDLPPVSVSLVPLAEAELIERFRPDGSPKCRRIPSSRTSCSRRRIASRAHRPAPRCAPLRKGRAVPAGVAPDPGVGMPSASRPARAACAG